METFIVFLKGQNLFFFPMESHAGESLETFQIGNIPWELILYGNLIKLRGTYGNNV